MRRKLLRALADERMLDASGLKLWQDGKMPSLPRALEYPTPTLAKVDPITLNVDGLLPDRGPNLADEVKVTGKMHIEYALSGEPVNPWNHVLGVGNALVLMLGKAGAIGKSSLDEVQLGLGSVIRTREPRTFSADITVRHVSGVSNPYHWGAHASANVFLHNDPTHGADFATNGKRPEKTPVCSIFRISVLVVPDE